MKRAVGLVLAWLAFGATDAPQVDAARLMHGVPAPKLADYGLFADVSGRVPAPGVTLYTLNTPLFSDHAEKFRYLWMPAGQAASYSPTGVLQLPVGSVLVKNFAFPVDYRAPSVGLRLIETRLLVRRADGWVPLSYVWNEAQTEAVLKRAGMRVPVKFVDAKGEPRAIDYAVPNTNQCKQCHLAGEAVTPIGPTAANLNDGAQLQRWVKAGKLTGLPAAVPRLTRWDDKAQPVAARARAYMEVNCGHCHSRAGFASNSGLYLQADETVPAHQGINKRPVAAGRGSGGREFGIKPGDPDGSILVHRMESTEPGVMMPQFGRTVVDEKGVALVRAYVAELLPPPT